MKARVISTNEIIDVEKREERVGNIVYVYYYAQSGESFQDYELEFLPDTPEDIPLSGWICRDKDGDLNFFYGGDKPRKEAGEDYWSATFGNNFEYLPNSLYPNVTWETEPLKVKLTLTPIG